MAVDEQEAGEVIGTLVTVMAVNYAPYMSAISATSTAITKWAQHIEEEVGTEASHAFFVLGIAATASAATAIYAWSQVASLVTETAERAERIGTSAGYLSQWNAASVLAGKTTDAFASSIESLHNRIREMSAVPVTSIHELMSGGFRPFTMLGLNPFQMRNMGGEEQMKLIAERISQVKDKTLQLTIAQEMFGDSSFYMLEYLKRGSAGIDELKQKMESFNIVLTDVQAETIRGAVMSWRELKLSMQGVGLQIATALAPGLNALASVLATVAQWVGSLLKAFPPLTYLIAYLGVTVIALFTALVTVLGAMMLWEFILPTLTVLVGFLTDAVFGLSAALAALNANPVVAIISLIAIAIVAVLYFTGALGKLKSMVADMFKDTTHSVQASAQYNVTSSMASPEANMILRDIANSARGQLTNTREMVEQLKKAAPPHMAYSW